jgi:putative FmdB family regulatory protein
MPIYLFECTECKIQKEEIVKMGTESTTCKECGRPTKKLLSMKTVALGLPNGHHSIRSGSRGK